MARRMTTFLLLAGLVLVLAASPAFGAKGGKSGSSIWVENNYADRSVDGAMHHGDPVAFGFTTQHWDDVYNTGPWLRLECYQGGNLVYWANRAGFEGGYKYGEPFEFGPSLAWPAGEADCQGVLGHKHAKNGKFVVEATIDLHVLP